MHSNRLFLVPFLLSIGLLLPNYMQAQLVNMEETWQEFLGNQKTSNVSKLVKPEKSQPANYIKYSLMYANSYFCADNLPSADKMMREIESMGTAVQDKVPGFKERYELMKVKIKAYKDLVPIWQRFLNDKSSVTRKDIAAVPEAKTVCEKGTLCKFFYMTAHAYYCEANLKDARNHFENRVLKLAKTSFDPKSVEGLNEEIEMMKSLWAGIDALNPVWTKFIETDQSPGFETDIPVIGCYTVPNIKVCLLKAAADFCNTGSEMLAKIKELQASMSHDVPGDVADKIAWLEAEVNKSDQGLANLNSIWAKFTPKEKLPSGAQYEHVFICDRSAEVKAYLMDGLSNPCTEGQNALDSITRIRKDHQPSLDDVTTSKLKKLKNLVSNEAAELTKLNKAWEDFLPDNKLSGKADFGYEYCDKAAVAKAYTMDGILNICERGQQRLDDLEKLKAEYSPELTSKTTAKIDFLQKEVARLTQEAADLKKAWDYLLANKEVSKDLEYEHEFICNREGDVQSYLLDGFTNPCQSGQYALDEAQKVIDKYNPNLSSATQTQLNQLKARLKNENQNLAQLNKTWKDFVPDEKLSSDLDIVFEYCDKIAQARSYIIDGTVNFCEKGEQRVKDIYKLREDYLLTLDSETEDKLESLENKVKQAAKDLEDVGAAWDLYVATDTIMSWTEGYPAVDTVVRHQIRLVDFYCDKIAQTKSWVIKGLLDPCEKGDAYLAKINNLKRKHGLSYDNDLACQVRRLEGKAYQCKYWTLVREARRVTHLERETFGPKSAQIMYGELNSDKQPCETTVEYEPLGYIGVRYIVAPHLCQKTNLAKMGDPEYYKKIATWVDNEVLSKYCEASMRCKEDFFIYLEGHTDGYRFSGRKYDQSLDIPDGTPYTHFLGNKDGTVDTLQKATRHITRELKSNMELGIARAWTVKSQLDFMKVPITIGAYEHPETEKGGEFRKIDIELNITNLLLDFYEKTLKRLVKESGIGERPSSGC